MAEGEVLLQNAKGRFVFVSQEQADSYLARTPVDKQTNLPRVVAKNAPDYARGEELANGGHGEGVQGDAVLKRTGEGLVPTRGE